MRRLGAGVGFAVSLAACAASAPPPVAPTALSAPAAGQHVREDVVTVYPGDDFFVAADERNGALFNLRVVPTPTTETPNVLHIQFARESLGGAAGGALVMLLKIDSHFAQRLVYRALMSPVGTPPTLFHGTSTCPLMTGVTSIEMWPDPITALKLLNFRVAQQAGVCKEY